MVVFFMPKTAYEMRMSDGSSDVCSSDLQRREERQRLAAHPRLDHRGLPFRRRPVQYRQVVHALGVHAIGLLVWPDGCALSGYLALQRLEKLDQRHAIGVAEAASDILMASVMIPADVGLELETGVALAANADFHRIEFTAADHEIGRESGREREGKEVNISVSAG